MNENEIIKQLKGAFVDKKALMHKLSIATNEEKKDFEETINHLLYQGIVGIHGNNYYLIKDQGIKLATVTLKKRNFVVLETIPEHEEIKISGDESDGLLVGDYLYVKQVQGLYHGIDYLKPVDTFRGRYSLDALGRESIVLDYLNECGKDILVSKKEEGLELHQGDLVEAKILSYSGQVFTVKVVKILVHASEVGSDIKMIIAEHDAPIDFPEQVLEEAKSIPQTLSVEEYNGREDYRNECVVTIDGNDSKDFDDAVSIRRVNNGYEAMVHIADVTHYMKPNSALDSEAVNRGTSIYTADRVVPMIPFELSNGICSLNPEVDRLTLTVIMEMDSMGNVFASKVVRSVIRSHGRLTYEKVNQFFDNGTTEYSEPIQEVLRILLECAQKIRRRRSLQGALKLESTELKFKLDENGNPTDVKKQVQGKAEMMIEDFMIVANCEVAKLLKKHNIPVLYRVHEFPPMDKLSSFKDFIKKMSPKSLSVFPREKDVSGARLNSFLETIQDENMRSVVSYMMLRAMAKAKYSPEALGHFGLAEPYYCHFTSPIRRYPDDIIHRLVKDYLLDKKPYSPDTLNSYLLKMGDITSAAEARATDIEREVDDLESAKYMTQHIGDTYHGKVTGFVKRGMFVETELGIEGFLPFHCMHGDVFFFDDRTYAAVGKHHPELSFGISTPIDVTVLSSNPENREIDFATPVFYKINAAKLSDEARADLAKNGIRVNDEEEDFTMMSRRPRREFSKDRYDDRRKEVYLDHDVRKPKQEDMPWIKPSDENNDDILEETPSGTGYTGKKKVSMPKGKFSDKKGFGKGRPGRRDSKFDRKPRTEGHQGYANYVRNSDRKDGFKDKDGFQEGFRREFKGRNSYHRDNDFHGKKTYGNHDGFKKRDRKDGFSNSRRNSDLFYKDRRNDSSFHGRNSERRSEGTFHKNGSDFRRSSGHYQKDGRKPFSGNKSRKPFKRNFKDEKKD